MFIDRRVRPSGAVRQEAMVRSHSADLDVIETERNS
jgi:hypothetical protein